MNDATAAGTAKIRSFDLDHDIVDGTGKVLHAAGATITVRKPGGGELRGLKLSDLIQSDYNALEAIAPRITSPVLAKPVFAAMDPADITQFAGEVVDFLLPKSAKPASPNE